MQFTKQESWFQDYRGANKNPNINNPIYLYCFHHAGGAAAYFHPWASKLPEWIVPIGIQLPGRWNRVQEQPIVRMEELISAFGPAFTQHQRENKIQHYAFYGHSLGGLVAYNLTKYLRAENLLLPDHFFVSSKRAPQLSTQGLRIYTLSDAEFENAIKNLYGAFPAEIASQPEVKKMFLDITKKDMELLDTYNHVSGQLLDVPMTVLGGDADHVITLQELEPWKELSSASCEILQLPGDHFFLRESQDKLLEIISDRLSVYK